MFAKEYRVAVNGNDENNDSEQKPFRTILMARNTIRESGLLGKKMYTIVIYEGVYRFDEPFVLKPEDSGRKEAITSSLFEKNGASDVNFVGSIAAVRLVILWFLH